MQKPNYKEEGKQEGKPHKIYRSRRGEKYVEKKTPPKKIPQLMKVYVNRKD